MVKLAILSIGLDNGLAPTRRQAIIWTKDGKFTDAYMRHSGHNELNHLLPVVFHSAISSIVTLLALGQSYDCPRASEITQQDIGKTNSILNMLSILIY